MKGRPLIEALLFLFCWFLLLWPLRVMTRPVTPAIASRTEAADATRTSCWVTLKSSAPLTAATLQQGAEVVFKEGHPDGMNVEQELVLRWSPDNRLDLLVDVSWAAPGLKALEITIEPDGLSARAATLWTEAATLHDVLVFLW